MKGEPLVTCVIPTRNRPSLLRRALDSVLEQTYEQIEVIIMVSPPHEPIRRLFKDYEGEDHSLRPIYIQDESGANVARNKGLREAAGEYIAFLDDDDIWKPEKISEQVPYCDEYSIVACLPTVLTEDGIHDFELHEKAGKKIDIDTVFSEYSILLPSSLVFRASELRAVGGFDEDLRWGEVWDVAVKILDRYDDCYILDQPLLIFDRKHNKERLSESGGNENLKQASEVYHRHKDKVKPYIARKVGVDIKYAYYQEIEDITRYKYLISGLRKDYELKFLRLALKTNIERIRSRMEAAWRREETP
jgi:glycosyltransferase involved in cell wall biosynthesis